MNLPAARSMTRKERKKFRAAGIDPAFQSGELSVVELNEKIIDFMVDEVYKLGEEYDDVAYSEFVKFCDRTYRMTYAMEPDIKNSEASGSGTLTDANNIVEPVE